MKTRFVVTLFACTVATVAAFAKDGAPSRLFPYYEEDAGVLIVGQATHVGSRDEIVGSGTHYQFLLSTGIQDADITDGRMIVMQLYCCGNRISADQAIWVYVPPGLTVAQEDFVEVRMGRVPAKGDAGVVNTVTAVRQRAVDGGGPCRWVPDNPDLWMRVVHCEGMEQQGWVQRGTRRKLWYRPVGVPDPQPLPATAPVPTTDTFAAEPAAEPAAAGADAPPDTGVVYVYHLSESGYAKGVGTLALRRAMIYMDDRVVASLTHGTHARLEVPTGPHTFAAKVSIYGLPGLPIGNTTLDIEKGGTYYLHYFERKTGVIGGYVSQHLLEEDAQAGAAGVLHTRTKPVAGEH